MSIIFMTTLFYKALILQFDVDHFQVVERSVAGGQR